MAGLLPDVDPDGLLEYSVVFTDRALNHMSRRFQGVMRDISTTLKEVYAARSAIIVPGSGTFAMEAVARQFASGKKCLIVRNGWFSFRWTQILDAGRIAEDAFVLKARAAASGREAPYAPPPIEEVVRAVRTHRPDVVFAPHVETASGIILPNAYLHELAEAVHEVGGLFVLDCVASGAMWVDMAETGIDVLISAPQKGWSSSPCCGFVMLSAHGRESIESTASTSFACDLRQWLQIMETYEGGGHAYYATLPTDALARVRDAMRETEAFGFERAREAQQTLGDKVRAMLAAKGVRSVAAAGFGAPGVVVSYTDDPDVHTGKAFARLGLQTAAGVPLRCDEPEDFRTFRIGLFGLDKLKNIERTVHNLERAMSEIIRTREPALRTGE